MTAAPIELLSLLKKDSLSIWKFQNKAESIYDLQSKSYCLEFKKGTKIETTTLKISNSHIIFQLNIASSNNFSLELGLIDSSHIKKRIIFSSSCKELISNTMHIRVPFSTFPVNKWSNIEFDLGSICEYFNGKNCFLSLFSVCLQFEGKLRKVSSMKQSLKEAILVNKNLHKSLYMPIGVEIDNISVKLGDIKMDLLTINEKDHHIKDQDNHKEINSQVNKMPILPVIKNNSERKHKEMLNNKDKLRNDKDKLRNDKYETKRINLISNGKQNSEGNLTNQKFLNTIDYKQVSVLNKEKTQINKSNQYSNSEIIEDTYEVNDMTKIEKTQINTNNRNNHNVNQMINNESYNIINYELSLGNKEKPVGNKSKNLNNTSNIKNLNAAFEFSVINNKINTSSVCNNMNVTKPSIILFDDDDENFTPPILD